MLVLISDNQVRIEIQATINKVIDDLSEWTANLPFTGVVGVMLVAVQSPPISLPYG
jgi:hypothetical protein